MRRALTFVLGLCIVAGAALAQADEPMDGSFLSSRACPALLSIRKETNPGGIETQAGQSYRVLAKNRKKATHYRIEVPGAAPPERWVAADCGAVEAAAAPAPQKKPKAEAAAAKPEYVLAISWQPAFCEGSPKKRECRAQSNGRFDASHFTLHGLWPQPGTNIFCGVTAAERAAATGGGWRNLPPLRLSLATQSGLEQAMPGAQSQLDRYEWIKHGTCYPGRDPETYYRDSLRLLAAVNASPVRDLMAENVGREVSASAIRARFDEAFGKGAGERVRIACRDDGARRLIVELTIGLRGDIPGGTPVADLIQASATTERGCPGGIVDAVGLQ